MAKRRALRVLIVDDQPQHEHVKTLKARLKERGIGRVRVVGFVGARREIAERRPDVIVLDLIEGDEEPGIDISKFVWKKHFCPIVIYSADPSRHVQVAHDKKFLVDKVKKGSGTDDEVADKIEEFRPYSEALRSGHDQTHKKFSRSIRDSATIVRDSKTDKKKLMDTIMRAARRRFAASLDETRNTKEKMGAWEMYVCPPQKKKNVLTGDILREEDGSILEPKRFRLVLSPSCDLVETDGRGPKAENILVAKCVTGRDAVRLMRLDPWNNKNRSRLGSRLNAGYSDGVLPLPALAGHIPNMAANMKSLELISFSQIGREFKRVASVDSPFRELVAWAYMQIGARPGLPERNTAKWAREIAAEIAAEVDAGTEAS